MGINIGKLIKKNSENISQISGKRVAIDASNLLYKFITSIRTKNGDLLRNKNNEVVSHLYGLFYNVCFLIENNISPIFIFDGEPPLIKTKTIEKRKYHKENARKMMNISLVNNDIDSYKKYSKQCSEITKEIIISSKNLLKLMGIPIIQSPSEAEAQASYMSSINDVDYVLSQDYDTLLFGSKNTIRKLILSSTKSNKLNFFEFFSLNDNLINLNISRLQLIDLCLCIGTDFNDGINKVGCKTALKLIKKYGTIESIIENKYKDLNIESFLMAKNFFLNPPIIKKYDCKLLKPDIFAIQNYLCSENNFSEDTVRKYCIKYSYNHSKINNK